MGWRDTITKDTAPADVPAAKSWRDTIQDSPDAKEGQNISDPEEDPRGARITDEQFQAMAPHPVQEAETIKDTLAGLQRGIPGSEAAKKLGAAADAGLDQLRGSDKTFGQDYDKWRTVQQDMVAKAAAAHPAQFKGGQMLGGLMAPNAGILGNAALAAGDMASRQDNLKDAVKQAAIDGGSVAAMGGLGALLGKLGSGISGAAEKRAVKSLDPTLNQQKLLVSKGDVNDLGRDLLDSGVVRFGSSVEGMAPRLEDMLSKKGQQIGDIRNLADARGAGVDMQRFADKSLIKQGTAEASNEAAQKAADAYARNANSLAKIPMRSVGGAQQEAQSLAQQVPFGKKLADMTPEQQAYRELRGDIAGAADQQVAQHVPESAADYDKIKRQFGLFKDADEMMDRSVARSQRNGDIGLRDLLVGNLAKGKGPEGTLKGVAGAIVSKLARQRGNSALAVTADKLGQVLQGNPEAFGKFAAPLLAAAKRGNKSLMATHLMLLKDPEYAALVGDAAEPNKSKILSDVDSFAKKYGTNPDAAQEPGLLADSFIPNRDHELAAQGWLTGATPGPPALEEGAAEEVPTINYGQAPRRTITQATTGFKPRPGIKVLPDSGNLSTDGIAELLKKLGAR